MLPSGILTRSPCVTRKHFPDLFPTPWPLCCPKRVPVASSLNFWPPVSSPLQPERALLNISLPFSGYPCLDSEWNVLFPLLSSLSPLPFPLLSSASRLCLWQPKLLLVLSSEFIISQAGLCICTSPTVWNTAVFSLPHLSPATLLLLPD